METKFYLRDKEATKPTPINLHVYYKNHLVKINIGERILPKSWNKEKQRPTQTAHDYHGLKSRLDKIAADAKNIYNGYLTANDYREPTPDILRQLIRQKMKLEQSEQIDLFSYFQTVINDKKKAAATANVNERNTVIPGYESTLLILKEFQKKSLYNDRTKRYEKYRLDFDTVNMVFYNRFMEFLKDEGYELNTAGKFIKNIKAVMRKAVSIGLTNNMAFTNRDFKVIYLAKDHIYLNEQELFDLYNLELKGTQEKVRDVFLVACWTGLRYSDLSRVNKDHIKGNRIEITTQKTKGAVKIALHPVVVEVLEKYNYNLPVYTNQHMNRILAEIGPVLADNTKVKVLGPEGMDKTKYGQIKTHTARRSFASNMYRRGDLKPATIMKITGHRTESNFFRYIKVTPDEHADALQQSFEKDRELYATGTTLKMQ